MDCIMQILEQRLDLSLQVRSALFPDQLVDGDAMSGNKLTPACFPSTVLLLRQTRAFEQLIRYALECRHDDHRSFLLRFRQNNLCDPANAIRRCQRRTAEFERSEERRVGKE